MADTPIPDPALVVLVGAAGSGKSTWAAGSFREVEVVSSDHLRSVVGSGPADLDATGDAFDLLDRIVAARAGRRLTTVVDTLGLDTDRRRGLLELARRNDLFAAVVVVDTPAAECRRRNAGRDRPVPAPALRSQVRRVGQVQQVVADEGWDLVLPVDGTASVETAAATTTAPVDVGQRSAMAAATTASPAVRSAAAGTTRSAAAGSPPAMSGLRGVVLQVSRFPWGDDPGAWLGAIAQAAEDVGFAGIALMDHLIQVPQVGRAWDPMPDPLVTLGALATSTTRLMLGTLVSPVTLRPPGVLAKSMATLDVLSDGRAFCGVGAGWFGREHAGFDIGFPPIGDRHAALVRGIEVMRALWAPGTKPYTGETVDLPETTSYPRPVADIPIVVGGAGNRTLAIAARWGDACNIRTDRLDDALTVLARHCAAVGREVGSDVAVTVLDLPVVGTDREDVATRVERLRGRTDAARFRATRAVGTIDHHVARYAELATHGVTTVFLAAPDLDGPADVERLAGLARVDLA